MSYTLRGRLESRLAVLLPVLVGACVLAAALHRWWPVEAVGLMLGVGACLDVLVYDRLIAYQPGWAALPLGALELGALVGLMHAAAVTAPLWQAAALFGAAWLVAQLLGHAGFPLLRLAYAEDGGELGRLGAASAVVAGIVLAAAGATGYAERPPVVHLSAGVHQGPLVIRRREVLVGSPGAVVKGGIVVAADDVTIRNVSVLGGEYGISVENVRGTVLDGVSVSGARLDGIHVRLAGIVIRDCTVDMTGNHLGQGIDISYNMDLGTSMIEGCSIVGGMEGITTHSSSTEIMHTRVTGTEEHGISVTEMSMGSVMDSEVSSARGVGIWCNDRSMCMLEHNTVAGMRPNASNGNLTLRGFGVLASFQSEADLRGNHLDSNPVPKGAIIGSQIAETH